MQERNINLFSIRMKRTRKEEEGKCNNFGNLFWGFEVYSAFWTC